MSLATLSGPGGSLQLPIVKYSYSLLSEMDSGQIKQGIVYYPHKVVQGDFSFTVQFRSVQAYEAAQRFIHAADKQALSPGSVGAAVIGSALRFYWPEMGIDYQGFIKMSPMGGAKFDFAPRVQYSMILIKDSIYTPNQNATQIPGFGSIYNPNTLNVDAATADPPLIPPAGRPGG